MGTERREWGNVSEIRGWSGIRPDDVEPTEYVCMVCGGPIPADANQDQGGEVLGCCSAACASQFAASEKPE